MSTLLLFTFAAPQMWLQIVLFVVGLGVVIWGADCLTDGAVGLAERMGIPQVVIGLTIVAVGTSMPEFFVSLISAINGNPDLAVGNIVGSNIFNALFIVGVAAALAPISILRGTVKKDIPYALVASVMLLVMCLDGGLSHVDGGILAAMFVLFMYVVLKDTKDYEEMAAGPRDNARKPVSAGRAVVLLAIGLACLLLGSSVFVDNASAIAQSLGMSDALIGLTIVSCGTSLPELATSVVAARRGDSGIAIGNVVGSNVFNILMTLGVAGLITPLRLRGITNTDLSVMVGSMVLLWLFSFTKHRVERWEGVLLVVAFVGYMG